VSDKSSQNNVPTDEPATNVAHDADDADDRAFSTPLRLSN